MSEELRQEATIGSVANDDPAETGDPVATPPTASVPTASVPAASVPTASVPEAPAPDLGESTYFFNRELSWLDFDGRVLELAEDDSVPLIERFKFAAIFASNLDEFVMIRLAGLHDQIDAKIDKRSPDGRTADETVDELRQRLSALNDRHTAVVRERLIPALADAGPRITNYDQLNGDQRAAMRRVFMQQIFAVLTPLAVGPGRPFPYISSLSLSLAVLLRDPQHDQTTFARVKVPTEVLPRFVQIDHTNVYVPLEQVIAHNLDTLFPGTEILGWAPFRVTRDADFTVSDEADDLLRAVEDELRRRRFGEVVRLEIGHGMADELRDELIEALEIESRDVYEIDGLLDMGGLWEIVKLPGLTELRDRPWKPLPPTSLLDADGEPVPMLAAMRQSDVLVHHPYESFSASVERFVKEAVADPDVLAIKLTVYRTSDDSPLVPALIRASEQGKQAVALVEVKARFDEQANITWARSLEQAGVHVVYGPPALKTHAKCVLVVRREGEGVRNYVHIGTGNYHATTARLYTDFGLFTTDEAICADVADMFNFLTGFAKPHAMRKVLLAPHALRNGILEEIEKTIAAHSEDSPGRITMKMNSLVDVACIKALYRASMAGVRVRLNIRGICCLRPGMPGASDNIEVVSVVGRFLEHSRVFAFERDGETSVYIGSADLMRRNLDNRVELVAPVEDPALVAELLDVLERGLADNSNAWRLEPEGVWSRLSPADGEPRRNVQEEMMQRHLERASEFSA